MTNFNGRGMKFIVFTTCSWSGWSELHFSRLRDEISHKRKMKELCSTGFFHFNHKSI